MQKLTLPDLSDCILDVAYIKLECSLEGKDIGARIDWSAIDVQFRLHLTQLLYDPSTGDIFPLSTSIFKKISLISSMIRKLMIKP